MSENPLTPRGARVEVGAWTAKGEFLGKPARLCGTGGGEASEAAHLYVGRGDRDWGIRFTLHSFDGGYRILLEEWSRGENTRVWLAPVDEEEESYIELFSEEEAREAFPYLFAALELPVSIEEMGLQRVGGLVDG